MTKLSNSRVGSGHKAVGIIGWFTNKAVGTPTLQRLRGVSESGGKQRDTVKLYVYLCVYVCVCVCVCVCVYVCVRVSVCAFRQSISVILKEPSALCIQLMTLC